MIKKKFIWFGVPFVLIIMSGSYLLAVKYAEIKAEKEAKAKIIAKSEKIYNRWKTISDITQKVAEINKKMGEIGNITDDGKIGNFESSKQLLELLEQKKKLHEEFGRSILEYDPGEQTLAWMGVNAARDAYMESQINLNMLTSIKSNIDRGLSELKKMQADGK